MSDVVVVTAFRGDGEGYGGSGWRDRAYTAFRDHIAPHFPILTADSGDEPFNISKSYNQAADADWKVAILHPPDEWVPIGNLVKAADLASTRGQVYAFDVAIQLTQEGTEAFYEGARKFPKTQIKRRLPKPGKTIPDRSGPRAVHRDLWDRFGGFYEGLTGWGAEDQIFAHCCRVFGGPSKRVPGTMLSMWHPRHDGSDFFNHRKRNAAELRRLRSIRDPERLRAAL